MGDPTTEPTFIDLKDSQRTFVIGWGDGKQSRIAYRAMRQACECALCVDELSGKRILDPESVPQDVGVEECKEIGSYGVQITWTDGHSTGIYTFTRLRRMNVSPSS